LGAEPEIRVRRPLAIEATAPRTSAEKVALFRSLFRGREEVFPTRFVSKKTGKAGYAPACRNKFVKGVCELPKVKCGECPNQAFIPFDDAAIVGHLTEVIPAHEGFDLGEMRDSVKWVALRRQPDDPVDSLAFARIRAASEPSSTTRARRDLTLRARAPEARVATGTS
jgi:hypothetical protein